MPLFVAPATCRKSRGIVPCGRRENPLTALHSNRSAYFVRRHSRDANDLIPTGLAGRYGNGRARNLQKICEEFDAGLIGPTVDRRRSQSQFKRAAELADICVFLRARVNFDCEATSSRSVANRNQGFQFHHRVTEPQRTSALRLSSRNYFL